MLCIVENKGAISNFDDDAMVEVPCVVGLMVRSQCAREKSQPLKEV